MTIATSTAISGQNPGDSTYFPALVTATGNDTTSTISSPIIDNSDGRIEALSAVLTVTASSGTSPTANVRLMGSNDGTNFFIVQSGQSTPANVETGAKSTSSATVIGMDIAQFARNGGLPRKLRLDIIQGGTTPGITGVLSAFIRRLHVTK